MTRVSLHRVVPIAIGFALLAALAPASAVRAVSPSRSATAPAVSWRVQSSGTQQALYAASCFDTLRCKAVGAGGTLLYTKNGGATWRPQHNPLSGSSTTLYRIACAGRSTCYIIGRPDLILVTHNGGVKWSTHRIPLTGLTGQLTDAACVSSQTYDLRAQPALCRLGLLDLACLDARTCYVVASVPVQAEFGSVGPVIYMTNDGGATWNPQIIPTTAPCEGDCGPADARVSYPLEWISCAPGLGCRAGGTVFIGSHEGYAWLTIQVTKPGAPWTPVNDPSKLRWASADSAVCPATNRCYGVWTTSPFTPGNLIWFSTDGGYAFTQLSSGSPRIRNAIACPGATACYSVGNQGTITGTTNGRLFVAQRSGTSHDLYGITCLNVNTCFAVGNKGTIVSTRR